MPLHVLVTGGTGYLGSILSEHLLDAGYRVTGVDRLLWNQNGPFHLCANPDFQFVYGDVRDESLMGRLVKEADVIIPLAAVVGASACDSDPLLAESTNLGAIKLINRLRSKNQPVIYPNTNSGYGTTTGEMYCTEETPLEPISIYGRTKVEAEQELLGSPNTVALRLATVFGMSPRMRLDLLVNHFVYCALTDGYIVIFEQHFKRNYIHVRDVADAFLHTIKNFSAMQGKAYNAGLDKGNLSKGELALKIKQHVPRFHIEFSEVGKDPDKRNYVVSNQRLREAGFEASRSLDDGIRELIKGYRMMGRSPFKNV
jgi:nucleoside-diphosphate-sugar epimerase